MADDNGTKKGLVIAAVAVVAVGVCVGLALVFTGAERPEAPPLEPAPAAEVEAAAPRGEAPAERVPAAAPVAAAVAPAPTPAKEIEPVKGALVELRFKDLAGFLRQGAQVADEVSPGAGDMAVAMLAANVGGRLDWLGEGPALVVVLKGTGRSFPVAASIPVRDADVFLRVLETLVGAREDAGGGVVRYVRPGAGGAPHLEVFARVAEGRAAVAADRELLGKLSGEPAPPEEDVWVRVGFKELLEAYDEEMSGLLAHPPPGVDGAQLAQLRTGMAMSKAMLASAEEFTVSLRIGEENIVETLRLTAVEGGLVSRIIDAFVPMGKLDELRWLPADCSMTFALRTDEEKLKAAQAALVGIGQDEELERLLKASAVPVTSSATGFGPGGKMAVLMAASVADAAETRKKVQQLYEGLAALDLGGARVTYELAARKAGETEIDRLRVTLQVADERAQMMMAMLPGLFEFQFAFPPGAMLMTWGMGQEEVMDVALLRPGAGAASLAASKSYKGLPAEACLAGEVYLVKFAAMVLPMLSAFGAPAVDLSGWTVKDIPHRMVGRKEKGAFEAEYTVPRAALRLYGEVLRAAMAAPTGAPAGGEDIGF